MSAWARRQHTAGARGSGAGSRESRSERLRVAGLASVVVLSALFVRSDALAQGCAMCSTVTTGAKDPLVKGMAYSIALMLAIPNVLIASIGGWLFYVYRRAAFRTAGALPLAAAITGLASSMSVGAVETATSHAASGSAGFSAETIAPPSASGLAGFDIETGPPDTARP